jgi:hypothetical protein
MQHLHETGFQPGTVVVTAASLARYAEFWLSLESLQVPHGTRLVAARGADIPHQLNEGVRKMTGEWVFFLGDDHTFKADIVLKLLARNVGVVLPVVPRRDHPYVPVLMHGPISEKMSRYVWSELPISGMFQLPKQDSAGQAGALVKKAVLDKLGDPWFEAGKLTPGRLMEDMYFVQRLHDLDEPIWIDCDQIMTHIANVNITPVRFEGRWYPGFTTKQGPVVWDDPYLVGEGIGENVTVVG